MVSHDILQPDAEGLWLVTVVATSMMLSRFRQWSGHGDPVILGNFLKRLSRWHQSCVIPVTNHIARKHRPPKFARVTHRKWCDTVRNGNVFSLHLELLRAASHQLIALRTDVGPQTLSRMQKWFQLMSETAGSRLFEAAPPDKRKVFFETLDEGLLHLTGESNETSQGKQEYPFFDPESLFIRVAHMVTLYTKTNLPNRIPNYRECVTAKDKLMSNWETLSGELLHNALNFQLNGLPLTDEDISNCASFSLMELPYSFLKEQIEVLPPKPKMVPVFELHEQLMLVMMEEVGRRLPDLYRLPAGEASKVKAEIVNLESLCERASETHQQYKDKLLAQEKYRRNYVNNRNAQNEYKPQHPKVFLRDIFVMGDQSHYFISRTFGGKGTRRFKVIFPTSHTTSL